MSDALTTRKRRLLAAIVSYHDTHSYMPTVRELCVLTGLASTSTVQYHMLGLEKQGYLRRDGSKARALVLTKTKEAMFS